MTCQSAGVPHPLRSRISSHHHADETLVVEELLKQIHLSPSTLKRIDRRAQSLVKIMRAQRQGHGDLDLFLHEYGLSSKEGVVLMCLAESLLRIPDKRTVDRLIRDTLGSAHWEHHLGHSDSPLVNASTWALMLTGRFVNLQQGNESAHSWKTLFRTLVNRVGEPLVRQAITHGMRIVGHQFVMGRTIQEALKRSRTTDFHGYLFSYDMLGEAARTAEDASRYYDAYRQAIEKVGKDSAGAGPLGGAGISIKLSALHPRYQYTQHQRVLDELLPQLIKLLAQACAQNISVTIDAEEADRLDLSLDLIEAVFANPALTQWNGFGIAIQAYQKRAPAIIDWMAHLCRKYQRRLMVRLVKGAYWDSEIKQSQELGLKGYPVFTRKATTDLSFLVCSHRLLVEPELFYPQFATHNAHTVASILEFATSANDFEFQRLHGMGQSLYDQLIKSGQRQIPCRIYAPVGSHEDLLAYLVRRLLENGSNTSFVNRIVANKSPIVEVVADPIGKVRQYNCKPHPHIPLPKDLFQPQRLNSGGSDLNDPAELAALLASLHKYTDKQWTAGPIVNGQLQINHTQSINNPGIRDEIVGYVTETTPEQIEKMFQSAADKLSEWETVPAATRADLLQAVANLFEQHAVELMALAIREAGKTLADAISEVREAIDYCRYYAAGCKEQFSKSTSLPGPTGESNSLAWSGRGLFVCISPWNFPLAIFCGQVAAALAAGNSVIAKPAQQTPLMATYATHLFHQAGIPDHTLHLATGDGRIGARLVVDHRIAGVAFTGSTETAREIAQLLAEKPGPIVPFIAETGGQNAMIVDSSALPERAVDDIIASAFNSAGQRCSALRVVFIQEDIADNLIEMLSGAMAELRIGDPLLPDTDIGPVIDQQTVDMLQDHAARMYREESLIYQCQLSVAGVKGSFFPPSLFEIRSMQQLEREVFGPILHLIRFKGADLDEVVNAINGSGYGLTLSIHSRIESTINTLCHQLKVGNIYVNRNQISAVVGAQPFGGERLSGTGPKAGGPNYLKYFATERVVTTNTTAMGGNTSLLSLEEEDI